MNAVPGSPDQGRLQASRPRPGWFLDSMRRRSDGFLAGIAFLIASAALSLKDDG